MSWNRVVLFTLVILLAVPACGGQQMTSGELAEVQQLAQTCPKEGHQLAGLVAIDGSGSGRDETIWSARQEVIKEQARRVAACSGHLRVQAFSASVAAMTTVFDGDLHPAGATEIARLRKVPELVSATMVKISEGLARAEATLPGDGSDITAQFALANEYVGQLNAGRAQDDWYELDVQLLTDGVQTDGVLLNTPDLSVGAAAELAARLPAPTLPPNSTVKVSGLGKVAGAPPPTAYVDALKAFYLAYCQRTGAACEAVTDYVSGR